MPRLLPLVALVLLGCASAGSDPAGDGSAGSPSSTGGTPSGGTGPGTGGTGGAAAGGAGNTSGGASTGGNGTGGTVITGGPGCGLESAAFCSSFDAPAAERGRAGELDVGYWAAGRLAPQLPSGNGVAIGVGPATLPDDCRADLPVQVFPSDDVMICDPSAGIDSNHLLVAAAAQNYGQTSLRIRRPFDFAGRTGRIVFDAEGFIVNGLLGWVSLAITEDPVNAPCFSIGAENQNNNEGSLIPRNALELHFRDNCAGIADPPVMTLGEVIVFDDYVHTVLTPDPRVCVVTEQRKLNRFEIEVSEQSVTVYVTDVSDDGLSFGEPRLLMSADVSLPFTRGYVHLSVHNHATLKYSDGNAMDAWIARFDNVAFDGPVLSGFREYEVPDSLVPGTDAWNVSGPVMSVGYRVADAGAGPNDVLVLKDVDLSGVTRARLSTSTWVDTVQTDLQTAVLRYRLNGKSWHDRPLTAGEIWHLTNGHSQGQLGQMMDVPLSDLIDGDNTLEFVTQNVAQNYPPVVANIDLVLETQ